MARVHFFCMGYFSGVDVPCLVTTDPHEWFGRESQCEKQRHPNRALCPAEQQCSLNAYGARAYDVSHYPWNYDVIHLFIPSTICSANSCRFVLSGRKIQHTARNEHRLVRISRVGPTPSLHLTLRQIRYHKVVRCGSVKHLK